MYYRITYRSELGWPDELVEADSLTRNGSQIVLRGTVLVVGRPREIVVRRLRSRDVAHVDACPGVDVPER